MQGDVAEDVAAIEFGTDGWRARLSAFTEPRVRMVGQAVATYLRNADANADAGGPVAVGYDARADSRGFAEELARVLCANGFDVLIPERDVPTPVVAWTVRNRELPGALMVTASHNPPEYNGIKFLPAGGAPALPEVTDAIVDALAPPSPLSSDEWGRVAETDLLEPYLEHALALADRVLADGADLDGHTVAYDAMHGSGRGVTDALLERAGADVRAIRCERDPDFGGDAPEPEPGRVGELVDVVRSGEADLGVVNDGDADRIGVVTPGRGYLDPNLLFGTLYDCLLEAGTGDVVRSVSTSTIVDRVAEAHGQAVHETPVGFKWVAQAMAENDALVGGEESGGYGLGAHLHNKDGVALALLAAAADRAKPIDDRVDELLAEHGEIHQDRISLTCPDDRKEAVLGELEAGLPQSVAGERVADVSTVDGFKMTLADGTWMLVRPSGTEPKLRIYAEARTEEHVGELLAAGRELVEPLV